MSLSPLHPFADSLSLFLSLAFTCAQNIFSVYNELKENTQARLNTVICTSIGSAAAICKASLSLSSKLGMRRDTEWSRRCLIDELLGILGYLAFGSTVGGNLIE